MTDTEVTLECLQNIHLLKTEKREKNAQHHGRFEFWRGTGPLSPTSRARSFTGCPYQKRRTY
jgi:hypothetical protein